MKFGKLLGFLLFLGGMRCLAQTSPDLGFIQWLSKTRQTDVLQAYLYSPTLQESDSLHAFRAMLAIQKKQLPVFFTEWETGQAYLLHRPQLMGRIMCSLLADETGSVQIPIWFAGINHRLNDSLNRQLGDIYFLALGPTHPVLALGELALDWQNVEQAQRKKAGIGALSSAVLPGSGSVYAGSLGRGITQFIFQGLLGLQAYEGVRRLGWEHPLVWLSVPLSTFFYTANIYGGARDVQQLQVRAKQRLYHHAANYYSVLYYPAYF